MSLWREQYDRMLRWRWRLWLGVEYIVGGSDEAAIDAFYAFAQTCYHLVDWLENDRLQHIRRSQAKAYVAASPVLAFCADICIGSMHAMLMQRRVRVKSMRSISGSYDYEDEFGQMRTQQVVSIEVFIEWNGEEIAVDAFASKCVEEWARFLQAEGTAPAAPRADPMRTWRRRAREEPGQDSVPNRRGRVLEDRPDDGGIVQRGNQAQPARSAASPSVQISPRIRSASRRRSPREWPSVA